MSKRSFVQSFQGPTDPMLSHSEVEGYQPVSRIGEVVLNCFVDGYEWNTLPEALKQNEIDGSTGGGDAPFEMKPHFHEWASVLPGMLCISRKARNSTFRNYAAAETAVPVIGCAAGLKLSDQKDYYFAGVCRSKTVRQIDDGRGPTEVCFSISTSKSLLCLSDALCFLSPFSPFRTNFSRFLSEAWQRF